MKIAKGGIASQHGLAFSLETLIYIVILFFYFRPGRYVVGASLYKLMSLVIICILGGIVVFTVVSAANKLILKSKRSYCPSLAVVFLVLTFSWCLIGSTVINKAVGRSVDINSAMNAFASTVGIILLSDIGLSRNPKRYMGCFVAVGSFMCFLNEITMFLFGHSGGIYSGVSMRGLDISTYYLLAEDNATFYWVWPVLILVWVYYYKFDSSSIMKLWAIVFTISTVGAYVYVWSVMAMVGLSVTAVLILIFSIFNKRTKTPRLTKKHRFSLFNVSWLLAALFSYLMSIKLIFQYFGEYIALYLNKSATLSGREYIWQTALSYINRALLFGYGYEPQTVSEAKLGINHTHNILLETMYRGGTIGLILFAVALFMIGSRAKKVQDNPMYKMLIAASFLFLILCSVEFAFYRYPYLIVFVLLCHDELFEVDELTQAEAMLKPRRRREVRLTL